jgi:hypothetical protein
MPSAVFNLDLIHTLHALHKRIDALEQATQLHARATGGAHTIKVAINCNVGSFHVSPEGIRLYEQLSGQPFPAHKFIDPYAPQRRTDPYLIEVIETLKDRASDPGSELVIIQIPSDIDWHIHEYDGIEAIYKTVDGAEYELDDGHWREVAVDSDDGR